jgi:hypothetical protein
MVKRKIKEAITSFFQNKSIDKKKKEFDKIGKVLNQKEIDSLLEQNLNDIMPVLESAIVSHNKVNGISYYTKYPIYSQWEGHDNFRKFAIAYKIGEKLDEISEDNLPSFYSILDNLSKLGFAHNPTKIAAWNSLGKIAQKYPEAFEKEENRLKNALSNTHVMDAFGGLVFADNLLNTSKKSKIENIVQEAFEINSKNPDQESLPARSSANALLLYFAYKNLKDGLLNEDNLNFNLQKFSLALKNGYGFKKKELDEGLKKAGTSLPLWVGTPDEKVVNKTVGISKGLFCVLGAYSLREYLENPIYLDKKDENFKINKKSLEVPFWLPTSTAKLEYNKFF